MTVMRWDPFRDLLSIQEMNQLLNRAMMGRMGEGEIGAQAWAPPVDIAERPDAYVVTVEVPGVNPQDVDVTLENGLLTIQGERRMEERTPERQYHRMERRYGLFRRLITLPSQVKAEAIEASYENGVLRITVPKAEEAKPKKIAVAAAGPKKR